MPQNWIDCTIAGEIEAGDHTVVLGTVTSLDTDSMKQPLVYYQGGFHSFQIAGAH